MYEMNIKSLNRTGDSVKKKSKKLYLEGKSLSSKKKKPNFWNLAKSIYDQ